MVADEFTRVGEAMSPDTFSRTIHDKKRHAALQHEQARQDAEWEATKRDRK